MFGKIKKKGWGTIDPACTIVNTKGQVIVDPLTVENMEAYGDELMDGQFNVNKFRGLSSNLDRLEYLHDNGYCAVEVPEGYIVSFLDKPTVEGEDHLRREYEEWSSRSKRRMKSPSEYRLSSDAQTAISVVDVEETEDITLAQEYIAFRDKVLGITGYDTDLMNQTIDLARGIAVCDKDALQDCTDELEGLFNLKQAEDEYRCGLLHKINRLKH